MAQLALAFLGPFQASLNGRMIVDFDTQKTRALLACLADKPGEVHARIALADRLWPDRPDSEALTNLRNNLANLRRAIRDGQAKPAFLCIARDTIAFNPLSDCSIDTVDFVQLVEPDESVAPFSRHFLARLEEGVSLYRGEFLEAFPSVDSSELDEWILARRAKYHTLQLESLYHLTKASLMSGEVSRALSMARRQLALEPWREEAYQQVIAALALAQRRSEALAEFGVCRDVLDKELEAAPGPVTLQLVESIRSGSFTHLRAFETFWPAAEADLPVIFLASPRMVSTHNLPVSLTCLVGREEEIQQVKRLLGQHRLLVLSGPGGIGKTRLGLAVAQEVVGAFYDGTWLVELTALKCAEDIPDAVLHAMGVEPGSGQTGALRLCEILNNRQMLIILDNCEHLVVAVADLIRTLLQACPHVKILATSRETFGISGEVDYRVPSLIFPEGERPIGSEKAANYSAVSMLVERAQAADPEFQINDANWPAVVYICKRLDGIPLALELAATHLGLLSPAQLAARLDGSFHFLTRGSRGGLSRHETLRVTIDWSYAMLSEMERRLLARFSVFVGGWTLEAAEEVCAGESITGLEVMDGLMRLVNKSMVSVRHLPEGQKRFYLLETVRQYAHEKLCREGADGLVRQRYFAWILGQAMKANLGLHTQEHPIWLEKFDAERENLSHALTWAIDERNDIPGGLHILLLLDLWWQRGRDEYRVLKWFQQGVANWPGGDAGSAHIYVEALSCLAFCLTERNQAVAMNQDALRMARDLNAQSDHSVLSFVYCVEGLFAARWNYDWQSTLEFMELAEAAFLTIQEAHPYPQWILAYLKERKADAYFHLGDLNKAVQLASDSWEMFLKLNFIWLTNPLRTLGLIAQRQGDFGKARYYFEKILAVPSESLGGWCLEGVTDLANLEFQQGHYREAIRLLQEALRRSREHFGYFIAINILEMLAHVEIVAARGQVDQAEYLARAACCLGAAEASRGIDELSVQNYHQVEFGESIAELQARMDPTPLQQAWQAGAEMTIDQAVLFVLRW